MEWLQGIGNDFYCMVYRTLISHGYDRIGMFCKKVMISQDQVTFNDILCWNFRYLSFSIFDNELKMSISRIMFMLQGKVNISFKVGYPLQFIVWPQTNTCAPCILWDLDNYKLFDGQLKALHLIFYGKVFICSVTGVYVLW